MQELITSGFDCLSSLDYTKIANIIAGVCYILSHCVQYVPMRFTEKVPDSVMVAVNLFTAKHGAKESASTDLKGNRIYE